MAYHAHRAQPTTRIELTPLIDVIFLLLAVLLYALALVAKAEVLPVKLPMLTTGQPADTQRVAAITLDRQGRLHLNLKPIERAQLQVTLNEYAVEDPLPKIYVAADTDTPSGRFFELVEMIRAAGIDEVSIVGQRAEAPLAEPTDAPAEAPTGADSDNAR